MISLCFMIAHIEEGTNHLINFLVSISEMHIDSSRKLPGQSVLEGKMLWCLIPVGVYMFLRVSINNLLTSRVMSCVRMWVGPFNNKHHNKESFTPPKEKELLTLFFTSREICNPFVTNYFIITNICSWLLGLIHTLIPRFKAPNLRSTGYA